MYFSISIILQCTKTPAIMEEYFLPELKFFQAEIIALLTLFSWPAGTSPSRFISNIFCVSFKTIVLLEADSSFIIESNLPAKFGLGHCILLSLNGSEYHTLVTGYLKFYKY